MQNQEVTPKGRKTSDFDLNELAKSWKAPIVARSEVSKFSGGLLHPRTLANLDCLGLGPESIRIGGRVCYPTGALVEWLKARAGGRNDG